MAGRGILLQVKMKKKGVSVMIGYVLLIALGVVMGIIVYGWIKTYVPTEALECPDGVSILVKEYFYNCSENLLSIKLKNSGRFSLGGYFIHATNSSEQELAAIDLSPYFLEKSNEQVVGGAVMFIEGEQNPKEPGEEWDESFDLTKSPGFPGQAYLIEIMPARYQTKDNKIRFVNCGNARIEQELTCS